MDHFLLQILLSYLLSVPEISLFLVNTFFFKTELNANPCRACPTPVMLNYIKISMYYLYPDMLQLNLHVNVQNSKFLN